MTVLFCFSPSTKLAWDRALGLKSFKVELASVLAKIQPNLPPKYIRDKLKKKEKEGGAQGGRGAARSKLLPVLVP